MQNEYNIFEQNQNYEVKSQKFQIKGKFKIKKIELRELAKVKDIYMEPKFRIIKSKLWD